MNEEMKTYFEGMEQRLGDRLSSEIGRLETNINDVAESVHALASHMDERFDELQPALSKVETHEHRIPFLEDKLPKLATN